MADESPPIQIIGALELGKAIDGLADRVRARVIRGALRKGAELIYLTAVRLVPENTGALANSIKIRTFWNKSAGVLGAIIGVGAGHLFKGDTFYAGFVEFGHRIGKRIRAIERRIDRLRGRGRVTRLTPLVTAALRTEYGDPRKQVRPYPFLRPAWDENKEKVKALVLGAMQKGIEREARKAAKEAG